MKSTVAALVCFASFTAGHGSVIAANAAHPVEQVIGMLQELMKTVNKESQEEEYLYGKFEHWCKTSKKTLNDAITKSKETIEKLEDTIAAKTEEMAMLKELIDDLAAQVLELDKQDTKAEALRTKENNLYKFTEKQLGLTISGIAEAIRLLTEAQTNLSMLQPAKTSVKALLALLEVHATTEQQTTLAVFAGQGPDVSSLLGPAPAPPEITVQDRINDLNSLGDRSAHVKTYEFKSADVIELLKQLKERFEADQLAVVKAETNALNAHQLAENARADERAAANKAKTTKEGAWDDAKIARDTASNDLTSTQDDLKADTGLLDDTSQQCVAKEAQWEARSKMRTMELSAMEAAINILAEVTGVRIEPPENPVPPPSPIAFLQIGGAPTESGRMRAVELLRRAARDSKSESLDRFAQELSAHMTGPFDEVNNMIEKMIFHLMAEQKDEDDHKNWCDLELNKTEASLDDKEDKIEELRAKINKAETYALELGNEITAANEMVAKIEMHMKESTEIREAGKKENKAAVKDAQDAQTAISSAIAVLETHYKESGMLEKESWEFLQTKDPVTLPDTPALWASSYTGVTNPTDKGGIISMLQVVNANFAKMEADTKVQEETDQKFYEEEIKKSEIEKATRLKEAEVKGEEKKRQLDKAATLKGEKKHVEEEHEVTTQYLKDLQKACVEGTSTYEARKAARNKEIEALKQAKDILKDAFKEPVSFLQQKRLRRA